MHRPTRLLPQAATGFDNVLDILGPVNMAIILGHFGGGVNSGNMARPLRTQLPLHEVTDDVVGHLVKLLYLVGHLGGGLEAHIAERGEFAA